VPAQFFPVKFLRAVLQLNRLLSSQLAFDKCMKKPEYNQTGEYRRSDSDTGYDDTTVHINSICALNGS
jgi:hypothetical protein